MKAIGPCLIIGIFFFFSLSCNTTDPDNNSTEIETTSEKFTIEVYKFGNGESSSFFNDVWVFSENNIWAVGYISPKDTTVEGVHITNPNIIKWDGTSWKLQPVSGTSNWMTGIWAADSSNIYFASDGIIKYEKGIYKNIYPNLNLTNGQRIEKLWGSSETNIWGAGPWGTVVHFDGTNWKKIDFDNQWFFYDITGDKETGKAYGIAGNSSLSCIIAEFSQSDVKIIYNSDESDNKLTAYGIALLNRNELLLSGTKIWNYNNVTKKSKLINNLEAGYYLPCIGMTDSGNIYFWGNKNKQEEKLIYYNGQKFRELDLPETNYILDGAISVAGDVAVLASYSDKKAYLVKVKRMK